MPAHSATADARTLAALVRRELISLGGMGRPVTVSVLLRFPLYDE